MSEDISNKLTPERELTDSIDELKSRFDAYMENSREGVWRIDLVPPLSLSDSEPEQISAVFFNTIIGEANDAFARQYGFNKHHELIGKKLSDFFPQSDPRNVETATVLVRQGFYFKNRVTHEIRADGSPIVILNNIVPTIQNNKLLNIWGSSIDITEFYKVQERLKSSEKKLIEQKQALEDKSIALKELIAQIELDKKELKDRIKANIESVILPSLDRISLQFGMNELIKQHRKTIESMTSSYGISVTDIRLRLTPREIEVCNMVKNGLSNKEISKLLHIAIHTVERHRRMVRKKLGLTNKGINLRTYLKTF